MKNLLFFILMSTSVQAFAQKWKCPSDDPKVKNPDLVLAQSLVSAELAGARLAGPTSACLNSKTFKYFPANNYGVNEAEFLKPDHLIPAGSPVKVTVSSTAADGEPFNDPLKRRATFTWQDSKGAVRRDRLYFKIFVGSQRDTYGCAGVITPPRKLTVTADCFKHR